MTEGCQKSHTHAEIPERVFLQFAAIVYSEQRMNQRKVLQMPNVTDT